MKTYTIPQLAVKWKLGDRATRQKLKRFKAKPSGMGEHGALKFPSGEVRRIETLYAESTQQKLANFAEAA